MLDLPKRNMRGIFYSTAGMLDFAASFFLALLLSASCTALAEGDFSTTLSLGQSDQNSLALDTGLQVAGWRLGVGYYASGTGVSPDSRQHSFNISKPFTDDLSGQLQLSHTDASYVMNDSAGLDLYLALGDPIDGERPLSLDFGYGVTRYAPKDRNALPSNLAALSLTPHQYRLSLSATARLTQGVFLRMGHDHYDYSDSERTVELARAISPYLRYLGHPILLRFGMPVSANTLGVDWNFDKTTTVGFTASNTTMLAGQVVSNLRFDLSHQPGKNVYRFGVVFNYSNAITSSGSPAAPSVAFEMGIDRAF